MIGLCFLASAGIAARPAWAVSTACDSAISLAATRTRVPQDLLRAIALTESGITVQNRHVAWPWSVNMAGAAARFADQAAAVQRVRRALATGAQNIDIGCFQINYRWHGHAFATLEDMFDPEVNALYAARYLVALKDEFGDWPSAVGAYHSRQPGPAAAYAERVLARLDLALPPQAPPPADVPQAPQHRWGAAGPLLTVAGGALLAAPRGPIVSAGFAGPSLFSTGATR